MAQAKPISKRQVDVLRYAAFASPNDCYYGRKNDGELQDLVLRKYLKPPFEMGFMPEGKAYFKITKSGKNALMRSKF